MIDSLTKLCRQAADAPFVRLYLDYDGTLADFVNTPDIIVVEDDLVHLIEQVHSLPGVLVAVISGRTLAHIQKLLPVPGMLLCGTYGIETQFPDGRVFKRMSIDQVKPKIMNLQPLWQKLIDGKRGYFLENKEWALALHARFADFQEQQAVLARALDVADDFLHNDTFTLLGGERFLEYAPRMASKSRTVQRIQSRMTPKDAFTVYFGDDDKDEEAFKMVHKYHGYAVRVTPRTTVTLADFRLDTPAQVREWLADFVAERLRQQVEMGKAVPVSEEQNSQR